MRVVKGPAPGLAERGRDDALKTFNHLSRANQLGITMVAPDNATKPDPNGEGGADVQFDMGNGDLSFTALGQDYLVKDFSGTAMHGSTQLIMRQFGTQPRRIRRAFVFVPETPMISAQMRVGRD